MPVKKKTSVQPEKIKALVLKLSDNSMLVIPHSEIKTLSALNPQVRNDQCKVNSFQVKGSMDAILNELGWEAKVIE